MVFLVAPALTAAPADDLLQQTLAHMDEVAATFKSVTADVKKTSHTAIIDEDYKDSGTLVVKRPKPKDLRALFDIKEPDAKKIAFSGRTGEIYYPKLNTVDIYDLDKKLGAQVNQYLLLGFGASAKDLQEAYSIKLAGAETVNGQPTAHLELTPRKPDEATHLEKVELWVSVQTGIAIQQKLSYRGGDYQLATYTNMKINPPIPDSAVTLNLPASVKRQHPLK